MATNPRRQWRVMIIGTGGMSNASARSRIYCYLPLLRERGIRCHVSSYVFHRHLPRRTDVTGKLWLELLPLRNVAAFLRADTIFLHRLNYAHWLVRFARLLRKRIVHDFDDAVYLNPPGGTLGGRPIVSRDAEQRLAWILRLADAVIVSGAELWQYASRHARDVRIIPTVVMSATHQPSVTHHPPVIGWVGAPENQRYLPAIESALLRLQEEQPALEVWIMTRELMDPPPRFHCKFIRWSLDAEAEWIPKFTVGIAPLDDDEWCRAKLNYKALVYMSHGVPAVASPVGFPIGDFADGESVRYARDAGEWYTALRQLIENSDDRDRLARNALKIVNEKYTAASRVDELAAVLSGV